MLSAFQHQLSPTVAPAPVSIAYLEGSRRQEILADRQVMAVIRFGSETRADNSDPRSLTVGLPELGGGETLEVWRSSYPLQTGTGDNIAYVCNDEMLFARLLVDEPDFPDLDSATDAVYRRLIAFIRRQGYPCLTRVWNYLPHINLDCNGIERYQAFTQGRYRALRHMIGDFETTLPAACAVGTQSPGLLVYCLATRTPGRQIENPRQLSAFRYPRQYGPKSPSFSRAVLTQWGTGESHLYISGTASIVDHTSRHAGDTAAQLRETFTNLEALLENANRHVSSPFRLALLRVYMRHELAVDELRNRIAERLGSDIPTLFLRADICRSDLLIEIEGLGISTQAS